MTAEEIIKTLHLQPLPLEGGFYRITYRAEESIPESALPDRYRRSRPFGGAIYFLETREEFSGLHKLATDEVYHFHCGDPLEILLLHPDGNGGTVLLGTGLDVGQRPQITVPRDFWQGSRPLPGAPRGFTLVSTTMAPAFEDSDVEFAEREKLLRQYPEFAAIITALTR